MLDETIFLGIRDKNLRNLLSVFMFGLGDGSMVIDKVGFNLNWLQLEKKNKVKKKTKNFLIKNPLADLTDAAAFWETYGLPAHLQKAQPSQAVCACHQARQNPGYQHKKPTLVIPAGQINSRTSKEGLEYFCLVYHYRSLS